LHSEALPNGMRVWNALHGGYSWVIAYDPGVLAYDPGLSGWSDSELVMWIGYTATYVRTGDPSRPKIVVEGGPFKTFREAEAACKATWHSIRTAQ
jgi:hypothetical protein